MFRGAFTALVTPFRDGRPDLGALQTLIDSQIKGKIHGLVPCGTTGESPTLSHPEHHEVVRHTVEVSAGRVPVIAGAGSNSTQEAISLTQGAKEAGADATLQITPYYNKPSQEGLYQHFRSIADKVDLPIILYNVPSRTGVDLLPETVARLAQHKNIVGIKEATGDVTRVPKLKSLCGQDFSVLSGDDFTIYPLMALGGDGVISVTSNILPGTVSDLCRAVDQGDHARARTLHEYQLPLCELLFTRPNPTMVKSMLSRLGICAPEIRLPLLEVAQDSESQKLIDSMIKDLKLS